MSEYGYSENTESTVDTSSEMADSQIDLSGTVEQADADFDAEIDSNYEISENDSEVVEDQTEEADADFDADTDSGFEGNSEMPENYGEDTLEESTSDNADADFDRDVESEEDKTINETKEDYDRQESTESEQFEDEAADAEDAYSENTEDVENVESENAEDDAEAIDSENTEASAENADSEDTEDDTEDTDSKNTEDTVEDVESKNTEDDTEGIDSENKDASAENADSENTEENIEDTDSKNTEDTAEDVESKNSEDDTEGIDSENKDASAENADSENTDSENTEDNTEDTDSENVENNAEDVESENEDDSVADVDTKNADENVEDTEFEDVEDDVEDTESENVEDNVAEAESDNIEDIESENEEEEAAPEKGQQEEKPQQEKKQEKTDKAEKQPAIAPMPISKHEHEAPENADPQPESRTSPVSRSGSQEVAAMQYESAAIVAPAELGDTITPEHADRGDERKDGEEKTADEADASVDDDSAASAQPLPQDEDQQTGQNAVNSAQSQTGFSINAGPLVSGEPQFSSSIGNDPQTNSANEPASSQDKQEEAFQTLLAYMAVHNYGRQDAPIYQNDPEWQKLQRAAYPDWTPPKSEEAKQMEGVRPGMIPAASILDVDSSGEYFWQEHSHTKADYLALAREIPEVQQRMNSGASLEELKKDPRLGACATAYFDPTEMVKVEHDQNGFHFGDNGRHRIAAAKELGINMPVLIIERNQPQTNGAEQNTEKQPGVHEIGQKSEGSLQAENKEKLEEKALEKISPEKKQTIIELFDRAENTCTPEEESRREAQKKMGKCELPGMRKKENSEAGEESVNKRVQGVESTIRRLWGKDLLSNVDLERETLAAARFKEIGKAQPETLRQMETILSQYQDVTAFRAKLAELPNGVLTSEQQQTLSECRHGYQSWLERSKEDMLKSGLLTEASYEQRKQSAASMSPAELRTEFGRSAAMLWDRQSEIAAYDRKNTPLVSAEYILANGDLPELQNSFGSFDKRTAACIIAAQNLPEKTPETIRASSEAVIKDWNAKHPDQPLSVDFVQAEIGQIGVGAVILETDGNAEEKIQANWMKEIQENASPASKSEDSKREVSLITSYKQRLSSTPSLKSGRWEGRRGESVCKSVSEEARRILDEHHLNGIQYKDAIPDFSPVAAAQIKLGYMTAKRANTDAVGGHAANVDKDSVSALNTAYYTPGNFSQSDALLAAQWTAEQKDGKTWTAKDIEQFRKNNGLTWHECNDRTTMQLVPSVINKEFSHLGGVGEEKEKQRILDDVLKDTDEEWSDGSEFDTMTDEQLEEYTRQYGHYDENGVWIQQDFNSRHDKEIGNPSEIHSANVLGERNLPVVAVWKNPEKTTPPFEASEYKTMVKELNGSNVEYLPIERCDKVRSSQEIIDQICGGDETAGSCSSLALAYIGNKAGYNVHDFRDGNSRAYFSSRIAVQRIAQLPGVKSEITYGKDDITCAKRLLAGMELGKEYYFASGGHAAIVRRNGNNVEYLELQHGGDQNGWHTMTYETLLNRFGCNQASSQANTSFIIEADSLSKSLDFLSVLGYINTEPSKQHKGRNGHVK